MMVGFVVDGYLLEFCDIVLQERGRALSLFEEGGPSPVATSDKVTAAKGPDYNELVISVNKCRGLIPNTSGMYEGYVYLVRASS